ncbi:MAG: dTDP-glucose 4,6-dehydratase [Elusimicrobia bacterium]|nr:dTDP-glucose 4,6-dehydratase [Elusimicrobiota bacterium]
MKKVILVTGGAGFIGSNFIRFVFKKTGFKGTIINLDKLTYAANPANLQDIDSGYGGKRYFFERIDICNYKKLENVFKKYEPDIVVHFAAESHVDRSIFGPRDFINTNINGTFNLLEAARELWGKRTDVKFHHISTDEVFGSLGAGGKFREKTPYNPRSPYSASKASSDHLVRAYFYTYGLPATISNCSNNYGPYQHPEKLIPLASLNAINGKPVPVYGDGKNARDWLYVEDHCRAIWLVINKGRIGETYNIGANCEKQNIEVMREICGILEKILPSKENLSLKGKKYADLITFVKDRPGHDRRYAIDARKITAELRWKPAHGFGSGLELTIRWYLENLKWAESFLRKGHAEWLKKNYPTVC